ncbi:MAG TPA: hypothetical protein VNB23_09400 [Ramlibacter sp.]|nr:hypothetical protein [Ramlibacter sp.]
MNTSQRGASAKKAPAGKARPKSGTDITPPPTGGNRGSPAASVMKQFAKTKAESSGRS